MYALKCFGYSQSLQQTDHSKNYKEQKGTIFVKRTLDTSFNKILLVYRKFQARLNLKECFHFKPQLPTMVFLVFSADNPIDIFIGTYMTAMFILLNTQASPLI